MLEDPALMVFVVSLVICPYALAVAIRKAPDEEKNWPKITSDPDVESLLISMVVGLSSFGI